MANIYTLKSGVASDTTVWSGGVVPVSGDRVQTCAASKVRSLLAQALKAIRGGHKWPAHGEKVGALPLVQLGGVVTQVLPPTPPSTFPGSSAPMRGKASHATMRAKEDVKATGRSKLKREDDLILLQF